MRILSIESSTKSFGIAVSDGKKVLASRHTVLKQVLSSAIIPAIDSVLKKSKLTLKKIDAIAIGLGPGSFTSLRVGLATAKGLAFAAQKPLLGIPSFSAVALAVKENNVDIVVLGDARRQMVYAGFYRKENGLIKQTSAFVLASVQEALKNIKNNTIVTGEGLELYRRDIQALAKDEKIKIVFADEKIWRPQAKKLAVLALARLQKNDVDNVDALSPLYLYPEDCQVAK